MHADGKVLSPQEEGTAGAKLRSEIVAEMQRQKDTISLFIDQDWNSYIRRMSQSGTWGGKPPFNSPSTPPPPSTPEYTPL